MKYRTLKSPKKSLLKVFSLSNQLRYSLILVGLLSVITTGGILGYLSLKSELQKNQELQENRSELAASRINNYLDDLKRQLGYLARVRGLTNLESQTQTRFLEGLIRHNDAYRSVGIVNRQGEVINLVFLDPSSTINSGQNLSNSQIFIHSFDLQEEYVSYVHLDPKDRSPKTILSVPIRNEEDRVDGVLMAEIDLRFLGFVVSNMLVGKTGYTYILDERYAIVAQTGMRQDNFELQQISDPELLQNLWPRNNTQLNIYSGLYDQKVLGATTIIPSMQWKLVVELPVKEAYAPIARMLRITIIALFLITLISMGIGFYRAHRILSPLKHLTEAALRIREGNFNTEVPITEANELGVLATAFNQMTAQVRELFEELEEEKTLLKQAKESAEVTLKNLRATQSQLIQAEKMSGLGQLVAGIAHEINNPISFIHSNLAPAQNYAEDLLSLIELYQTYYPDPPLAIAELMEEIELEFVLNDFQKILSSMKTGSERIREIVKSLRNFSRLDEDGIKEVDLHEGIENSLLILQNRLRTQREVQEIQVIRNYGTLPKIECYPGYLNQVFMNILANGIDALETQRILTDDSSPKSLPTLTITTALCQPNRVMITIADNGLGIPPGVQEQIFNPFFTTKPIGQGTGLGLSISYQIVVERHGGSLSCHSEPGGGAEFQIELPISQGLSRESKRLSQKSSVETGVS
ncbi:cache domain-containing protein [Roseofilum sp. BLCC_M91]|uniref:histidine kinase n=1 Tax=Roseofilum halophilum BLCC-M91 TaxID=3022259 RepID=A0ABT7BKL0_9CYAN|nr:cache domain-containing protein [Roseofilum halophilum]MDJ1179729.1 cache domain-containing protein [Roseofilum halophilum BLCC-M91]